MTKDIHFYDKYLGTKFHEVDEDGYYSGCLYPVYLIYPNAYKFKPTDDFFNEKYIFKNVIKDGVKIDYPSNFGDVVVVKVFGQFHFFVFVEHKKYAHITKDMPLSYVNIENILKKRVIGCFRHKENI